MKRIVVLGTLASLIVIMLAESHSRYSFAQEPQPSELAQANRLTEEADRLYDNGKYSEAIPLYARAFAAREQLLQPGDVKIVVTALRYACVLRRTNQEKEAETIESRSQLNRDKQFPPATSGSKVTNGGVRTGKLLSSPQPANPTNTTQAGISGKVTVRVLIDEKGSVINACAVSGNPSLWPNAERAAYNARYSPTTLMGVPIRTPGVLTVDFKK